MKVYLKEVKRLCKPTGKYFYFTGTRGFQLTSVMFTATTEQEFMDAFETFKKSNKTLPPVLIRKMESAKIDSTTFELDETALKFIETKGVKQ